MVSWKDIKETLVTTLIVRMSDAGKGHTWLDQLRHSQDGERLGICMAIDITAGAVDAETFASILDHVDLGLTDARYAFAQAVGNPPPPTLVCASKFATDGSDNQEYARVLELGSFIDYYVGAVYHRNSLEPEDVRDVRHDFFSNDTYSIWPDINVEWSGTFGRVFVTSFNDLEELLSLAPPNERGTVVNDAMGLGLENGVGPGHKPEFIAVKYPAHQMLATHQPTTLDIAWTFPGGFYLSFGDVDKWGRTHSCTGQPQQVRERIHRGFNDTLSSYAGLYIGVSDPLTPDPDQLIKEAYKRVTNLIA